jgi:hypothetical protein
MGLLNRSSLDSLEDNKVISLKKLWKNNVPSKISIFGWRLLLEKLATREALFDKGVISNQGERSCVFCYSNEESLNHLFLHCKVVGIVWQQIFNWMSLDFFTQVLCNNTLSYLETCLKGRSTRDYGVSFG